LSRVRAVNIYFLSSPCFNYTRFKYWNLYFLIIITDILCEVPYLAVEVVHVCRDGGHFRQEGHHVAQGDYHVLQEVRAIGGLHAKGGRKEKKRKKRKNIRKRKSECESGRAKNT
jgi:hypothetical protein